MNECNKWKETKCCWAGLNFYFCLMVMILGIWKFTMAVNGGSRVTQLMVDSSTRIRGYVLSSQRIDGIFFKMPSHVWRPVNILASYGIWILYKLGPTRINFLSILLIRRSGIWSKSCSQTDSIITSKNQNIWNVASKQTADH